MDLQLSGRHVLVTGGSKGIGYACAQAFLAEGAVVSLLMAAGLVELHHAHVGRLEEVAHRRIDEGQVPVLADAQDRERWARLAQERRVAPALRVGVAGLPGQAVEGAHGQDRGSDDPDRSRGCAVRFR